MLHCYHVQSCLSRSHALLKLTHSTCDGFRRLPVRVSEASSIIGARLVGCSVQFMASCIIRVCPDYFVLLYHVVCEGRSGAVLTPLFALVPPAALPQDHITTASVAQPA